CPLAVPTFTGRQENLQEIHQFFDGDQRTRLVFVLHGLGGSGKSQLAFKFVEEAQEKEQFTEVIYIDATNKQTAETDLQLLGPETVETAEAALLWLASTDHTQWLIVFDNADDITLDLAKFFPQCRFGNILITTRNPALCIHGTATQVSNMELGDATELLLKLAGRKAVGDNKKELATAIVKELHCFPLAVSQAGGYINAQGDFEGYLALYKVSRDRLLKRNDIQGQSQYNTPVYATWDLSYNKLNPAAKLLLQIFSQLHHEGITKEIFEKASLSELRMDDSDFQAQVNQVLAQLGGSNRTWDALVFSNIVGELQAYSLIEQNLHNQSFSVHP
ncbi:P-loop containing nucleoside triphosphate hydrolase protein, partial [Favolaschia claudopus]